MKLFMHGRDQGLEAEVHFIPDWATHIIERKSDKKLFVAMKDGDAYHTSPNKVLEFNPDGYMPFDSAPFKLFSFDPSDGPKCYSKPEYKVGDKWWVAIPGQHHLVDAKITKVGILVIGLEYFQDGAFSTRTFKFGDVDMYEPKAWTE